MVVLCRLCLFLDLILWTARDGKFSQQEIDYDDYDDSSSVHFVTAWSREISVDRGTSYMSEGKREFENESIVLLANKKDS